MNRRSLALTLFATCAIGIVAASEVAQSRAVVHWGGLGEPDVEIARRVANRFHSDVRHGRKANQKDFARLLAIVEHGGPPSAEAFFGLHALERTGHRAHVLRLARRAARSRNDKEAYGGIQLLRWWHEPDWRALALSHEDEPGFWFQAVVDDARQEP